jgi:hypothetical protein
MEQRQERILRTAFLSSAVTDALALVPMLFPPMARLLTLFVYGYHYPQLRRVARD